MQLFCEVWSGSRRSARKLFVFLCFFLTACLVNSLNVEAATALGYCYLYTGVAGGNVFNYGRSIHVNSNVVYDGGDSASIRYGTIDVVFPFYFNSVGQSAIENGIFNLSAGEIPLTFYFDGDSSGYTGSSATSYIFVQDIYVEGRNMEIIPDDGSLVSSSRPDGYKVEKGGRLYFSLYGEFNNYSFNNGLGDMIYLHVKCTVPVKKSDAVSFTSGNFSLYTAMSIRKFYIFDDEVVSSGTSVPGLVGDIDQTIKDQHEEEKTEADSAGKDMGSELTHVTDTLSSVEILKLPWTMLTDLFNAIQSQGETTLTFPSFSLMGQELWPEYVFSLSDLDSNFDVLFRSVRLVSGIMLCVAFGSYVRSFFTKVFGRDEAEEV